MDEPQEPHYFSPTPSVGSAPQEVEVQLDDGPLRFRTDRGVFSNGRLDAGTAVLLHEAPELPPGGDLLDLGCGAGPLALTMARRRPDATVWAVDVNERAVGPDRLERGSPRPHQRPGGARPTRCPPA